MEEQPTTLEQQKILPSLEAARESLAHFATLAAADAPERSEIRDNGDNSAPDGKAVAEDNYMVGALEKARFFVREKVQKTNWRKAVGTFLVATSFTAFTPEFASAQESKRPSVEARMAGEVINDTYPYANAPLGTEDNYGNPVRECASYVKWKLAEAGVDPRRFDTFNLELLAARGEIVDNTPAVGAKAVKADRSHDMYVHEVTETTITVSEYNATSEYNSYTPYRFGVRVLDRATDAKDFQYVHFEIPNPPGLNFEADNESFQTPIQPVEKFMGAKYDKQSKNTLTIRRPLKKGTFIQSPSGRFRLVQQGVSLDYWDAQGEEKVVWHKFLNGKNAPQLRIKPDTRNNKSGRSSSVRQNVLALGTARQDFLRIPIGTATRIVLGDDGKFAGYRGNSNAPVWQNASNLAGISRSATAAVRKASKANSTSSTKPSHK